MKLNISWPFQLMQWTSYVTVIFIVQIIIILPLSFISFNDFYQYLIPTDSSQLVPLSAFNLTESGRCHFQYTQLLDKVSAHQDLPIVKPNGLIQHIPVREHIDYRIDATFKFFCLINEEDTAKHNLQTATVSVYTLRKGSNPLLLHSKYVPIVCITPQDKITLPEGKQLKHSRLSQYRTEWLNEIKIDDISDLTTDSQTESLVIGFNFIADERYATKGYNHGYPYRNAYTLLMNEESKLNLRINFNQGIRNLMLRYRIITYVVGTIVVHILISFLMIITTVTAFYLTNQKLAESDDHRGKKVSDRFTEARKQK
ncbi:hypothetical protein C6P45_003060 [Maudiozyma exigua]|uniref:Seipin n=1 Tax=Maudiozyma exigua TaxID=34358 RepID=A0A9P7BBM2_MAUEX|nr:hypothetical protein C6P45_003060 [Kazachstania exigua]